MYLYIYIYIYIDLTTTEFRLNGMHTVCTVHKSPESLVVVGEKIAGADEGVDVRLDWKACLNLLQLRDFVSHDQCIKLLTGLAETQHCGGISNGHNLLTWLYGQI